VKASGARTFRVYATRFDSGGSYIVALPDKCVKFANAGNSVCADEGYRANQNYSVSLNYKGGTTAKVLESGPWNIDDTYWATTGDPTPRRMFTDLPLGMPEAQAAYFNNYNGGLDQFGRMVSAPYGIDLARQVSIDIGLEPGNNDWIDVTFLWTKGWEGGSEDGSTSQGSVPEVIVPVETATPMPDGSIIHEVQQGQAPLHIAKAYAVELSQLFELNELTFDSIIQPGDKLVVQPAQKALTPSPDISLERVEVHDDVKVTSNPTRTPVPKTDTPKATIIATSDSAQPKPNDSSITQQLISRTQRLGVDIILIVIVVLIFVGSVLLLFGRSMKGKP
jgi:LysM repeat protein